MNAYRWLMATSSVVFCWVLPVSPLLSIAALRATRGEQRTPLRRLAISGAVLSATFTLAMSAIAAREAIRLGGF